MSYECPRCGTTLVETDDEVNDYELEGAQVRHTVKRCEQCARVISHVEPPPHGACAHHGTGRPKSEREGG